MKSVRSFPFTPPNTKPRFFFLLAVAETTFLALIFVTM